MAGLREARPIPCATRPDRPAQRPVSSGCRAEERQENRRALEKGTIGGSGPGLMAEPDRCGYNEERPWLIRIIVDHCAGRSAGRPRRRSTSSARSSTRISRPGKTRRTRRDAVSARAERLPAHRPREVDLPELRRRRRVRRHLQPALRRHEPDEGRRRVRRLDQGRRALARLRVGRACFTRPTTSSSSTSSRSS